MSCSVQPLRRLARADVDADRTAELAGTEHRVQDAEQEGGGSRSRSTRVLGEQRVDSRRASKPSKSSRPSGVRCRCGSSSSFSAATFASSMNRPTNHAPLGVERGRDPPDVRLPADSRSSSPTRRDPTPHRPETVSTGAHFG